MSWILVCDAAKALLFQNVGDAQALNLKAAEVRLEPHPPTRDLGSDRPGRAFDSGDGSPSAMENTDWHNAAEADFLRGLAGRLDELVRKHGVKHLIVVAPPKALGILRQHFTPAVRDVLSAEIPKDLVKLPTIEIERRLSAIA
jgi:protein required for attachment to host cells